MFFNNPSKPPMSFASLLQSSEEQSATEGVGRPTRHKKFDFIKIVINEITKYACWAEDIPMKKFLVTST